MAYSSFAQSSLIKDIDRANSPSAALAPLHFLASDELMGRSTTRPEIHTAARYISEQFRSMELKQIDGTTDFFQTFWIRFVFPSSRGTFSLDNTTYTLGQGLLQTRATNGLNIILDAPIIYVGKEEEIDKGDVKGKILLMEIKTGNSTTIAEGLRAIGTKSKIVKEKGALALLLRYEHAVDRSWDQLQHSFTKEYVYQDQVVAFPVYLINDEQKTLLSLIKGQTGKLKIEGNEVRSIPAKNVMGIVEGTDAKLKEQYIVLSAHYDHLGVAAKPKMEEGKLDSIYNGARDNAIGTAAVINAARYFSAHPPKRSVLFIAFTGEEMGLLGSRYFAEHPTIPLKKLVYNLNIDNASYNDTSRVTVVGLGRTSADEDIQKACVAYGLTAMPDPAPEQNLFDRSDNVNLAIMGVPAPTFSLGIKKFDETITSRYHQLSDEVGNMDLDYAMKYIKSFILSAKNIADNPAQPEWKKGDKYETAWRTLYKKSF